MCVPLRIQIYTTFSHADRAAAVIAVTQSLAGGWRERERERGREKENKYLPPATTVTLKKQSRLFFKRE